MMKQVVLDLRPFLLFFVILLILFAVMLAVIDWGNYEYSDDPAIRTI